MSFSKTAKAIGWTSFFLAVLVAFLNGRLSGFSQIMEPIEQLYAASFLFSAAFITMQNLVRRIESGHPDITSLEVILKELAPPLLFLIIGLIVTSMSIFLSLSR